MMKRIPFFLALFITAACATVDEVPDVVVHPDADVPPDLAEDVLPQDEPPGELPAEDQAIDPAEDPLEDQLPDPDVTPDPTPDLDIDPDVDPDPDIDPDPDVDPEPDPDDGEPTGGSGTCADPFIMPGPGLYTGDTTSAPLLHDPYCDGWQQSSAEHVWLLTISSPVSAHFYLHPVAYWDPSIYINGDCNVTADTTLAFCADANMWGLDEDLWADLTPGSWYVFVDGYISTGTYELTVTY